MQLPGMLQEGLDKQTAGRGLKCEEDKAAGSLVKRLCLMNNLQEDTRFCKSFYSKTRIYILSAICTKNCTKQINIPSCLLFGKRGVDLWNILMRKSRDISLVRLVWEMQKFSLIKNFMQIKVGEDNQNDAWLKVFSCKRIKVFESKNMHNFVTEIQSSTPGD